MILIIGEIITIFGIFYSCNVLLAVRNPDNHSWWMRPIMQETVHLFVTLGCLVFGPVIIVKAALKIDSVEAIGLHAVIFLVLAIGTIFLVKRMRIKERLAKYDAQRGKIVDFPPQSPNAAGDSGSHAAHKAA
jgi:hypothetical protein